MNQARDFACLDVDDDNSGQAPHSWHGGTAANRSLLPNDHRPALSGQSLQEFALASFAQGGLASVQPTVARPQGLTFNEAVVTMIINCVGAGVVLFPKIMSDVGMLIAPLLCAVCALTCL